MAVGRVEQSVHYISWGYRYAIVMCTAGAQALPLDVAFLKETSTFR